MKPILQALVLAERIYEEKNGKKIIAGTFNGIIFGKVQPTVENLPNGDKVAVVQGGTDSGCPAAYISLTDVVDGTEIILQFVNVTKNEELFGTSFRIEKADRLSTVEIIAALPPLSRFVKEAGTFSLDVIWQGEILGSHRLRAVEGPNIG
jgi:hypothetical protein